MSRTQGNLKVKIRSSFEKEILCITSRYLEVRSNLVSMKFITINDKSKAILIPGILLV